MVARPNDDRTLSHWGIVGATYTTLVGRGGRAGRYTLIDMHAPPAGGPPLHSHDFEEMFSVLEGEIELTFRGARSTAHAGETVNIPANAPDQFTNFSEQPARLPYMRSPSGQKKAFAEVGIPPSTHTEAPPKLDEAAQKALMTKSIAVSLKYRTELLLPLRR